MIMLWNDCNYTLRETVLGKDSKEKKQPESFWEILYMDIEPSSVTQEVTKLCKNFTDSSLQNWRATRDTLYFKLLIKLTGMVWKTKIWLLVYLTIEP